jgi:hypothetical protein
MILLALGMCFSGITYAQDESADGGGLEPAAPAAEAPAPSAKSPAKGSAAKNGEKKKTTIDFEDELVEGELKKPELFYLLQKKQFNFKRLIKLRENFLPEMRRDGDEIRRSRSKN